MKNNCATTQCVIGAPAMWLLILVAVLLRYNGIETQSFWKDELYTAVYIDPNEPVWMVLENLRDDVHPPLFFYLMRGVVELFGDNFIIYRGFSLVCSVLMLVYLGVSTKNITSFYGRFAVVLLAAFSLTPLIHAVEARSYALLMLLSSMTLVTALDYVTLFAHKKDECGPKGCACLLRLQLFFCALLLSLTHYYGMALAGSVLLLVFLFRLAIVRCINRAAFADMASGLVVGGACAAWIWSQKDYLPHEEWMTNQPHFLKYQAMMWVTETFGSFAYFYAYLGFVLVSAFLGLFGAKKGFDGRRKQLFLLLVLIVMGAVVYGVNYNFKPVFSARNLAAIVPLLWLLPVVVLPNSGEAGEACALPSGNKENSKPAVPVLLFGALFVVFAFLVAEKAVHRFDNAKYPVKQNWRDSAAWILQNTDCHDRIMPVYGGRVTHFDRMFEELGGKERNLHFSRNWNEGDSRYQHNEPFVDLHSIQTTPRCPVMMWAAHSSHPKVERAMAKTGFDKSDYTLIPFYGAFVVLDAKFTNQNRRQK